MTFFHYVFSLKKPKSICLLGFLVFVSGLPKQSVRSRLLMIWTNKIIWLRSSHQFPDDVCSHTPPQPGGCHKSVLFPPGLGPTPTGWGFSPREKIHPRIAKAGVSSQLSDGSPIKVSFCSISFACDVGTKEVQEMHKYIFRNSASGKRLPKQQVLVEVKCGFVPPDARACCYLCSFSARLDPVQGLVLMLSTVTWSKLLCLWDAPASLY